MLTDAQVSTLFTLIHDKSHIMPPGKVTPSVDSLMAATKKRTLTRILWRGISKEDLDFVTPLVRHGGFLTYQGYLSTSRSRKVAEQFARAYKTNTLLRIYINPRDRFSDPEGLDVVSELAANVNPQDDGEVEILKFATQEQEIIFRQPRLIFISDKTSNGMRIITMSANTEFSY